MGVDGYALFIGGKRILAMKSGAEKAPARLIGRFWVEMASFFNLGG